MTRHDELDVLIPVWATRLHVPPGIDPVRLLKAIAMRESRYGVLTTPRREPAYCPKGRYFDAAQARRYQRYGSAAACSYSSFQVMFPVACELGYAGTPEQLGGDAEGIQWAVELLNTRIFGRDQARTIEEIGDAYNSGSCKDRFKPIAYMQAVKGFYDRSA